MTESTDKTEPTDTTTPAAEATVREMTISPAPVRMRVAGTEDWLYCTQRTKEMGEALAELTASDKDAEIEIEVEAIAGEVPEDPEERAEAMEWVPHPALKGGSAEELAKSLIEATLTPQQVLSVLRGTILDLMYASTLSDIILTFRDDEAGCGGFSVVSPHLGKDQARMQELVDVNLEHAKKYAETVAGKSGKVLIVPPGRG